ncbi:exopolysaccharide biosynthesis polyprenyl glycosylphosphotransferase [bacterium]|nr:exopolysaccharide biosynthesis polyprenyl glycosylphosphotransferase [bacterium]MBU1753487.1 exopolysaccharide biosynthesis polyprenyl glycosylphosphotransferase [bacterium]
MWIILSVIIDALLINAGIISSFLIRFGGILPHANFEAYQTMWIAITTIMLLALYGNGAYLWKKDGEDIHMTILKAITAGMFVVVVVTYVNRTIATTFPTSVFVISWFLNIFLLSGWRVLILELTTPVKRILIVGDGDEGIVVAEEIQKSPKSGYELIGFIGETQGENILGQYSDLLQIIKEHQIDEVIITIPPISNQKLWDIVLACEDERVRFKTVPDIYESVISKLETIQIETIPLIDVNIQPISGWNRSLKRIIDITASIFVLFVLFPFLIIIAILIKIDSKGPIVFSQERVGRDGHLFNIYKFRTMMTDAEKNTGPVLAQKDDERITKLGRFLRHTRMDEILQCINVLMGQMSLVGPRPERLFFVEQFKAAIPGYVKRFKVRPGITGLAQVNANYDISPKSKLKYDLLYIKNYSLVLDFKLMLKTLLVVFGRKGAR